MLSSPKPLAVYFALRQAHMNHRVAQRFVFFLGQLAVAWFIVSRDVMGDTCGHHLCCI